jgi:hypothetical protein
MEREVTHAVKATSAASCGSPPMEIEELVHNESSESESDSSQTQQRKSAAAAAGVANTPRRRRNNLSGIDRERQGSTSSTSSGSSSEGSSKSSRRSSGRRSSKGGGGLSKKTLAIVSNLEGHATAPQRTQQELDDLEEEKRQADEERRLKEALRQKGDSQADLTIRVLLLGDSGVVSSTSVLSTTLSSSMYT